MVSLAGGLMAAEATRFNHVDTEGLKVEKFA